MSPVSQQETDAHNLPNDQPSHPPNQLTSSTIQVEKNQPTSTPLSSLSSETNSLPINDVQQQDHPIPASSILTILDFGELITNPNSLTHFYLDGYALPVGFKSRRGYFQMSIEAATINGFPYPKFKVFDMLNNRTFVDNEAWQMIFRETHIPVSTTSQKLEYVGISHPKAVKFITNLEGYQYYKKLGNPPGKRKEVPTKNTQKESKPAAIDYGEFVSKYSDLERITYPLFIPHAHGHGKLDLLCLGTLVTDPGIIHNFVIEAVSGKYQRYPVPIGYSTIRRVYSIEWEMTIENNNGKPLFSITNIATKQQYTGGTARLPWVAFLQERQRTDSTVEKISGFSGSKHFGLSHPQIQALLTLMPGYDLYFTDEAQKHVKPTIKICESAGAPSLYPKAEYFIPDPAAPSQKQKLTSQNPLQENIREHYPNPSKKSSPALPPISIKPTELTPLYPCRVIDEGETIALEKKNQKIKINLNDYFFQRDPEFRVDPTKHQTKFALPSNDFVILDMGTIVLDKNFTYNETTSLYKRNFPITVGYKATRKFNGIVWTMTTEQNLFGHPVYTIVNTEGAKYSAGNPCIPWFLYMREAQLNYHIDGIKLFGFDNSITQKLIAQLPGFQQYLTNAIKEANKVSGESNQVTASPPSPPKPSASATPYITASEVSSNQPNATKPPALKIKFSIPANTSGASANPTNSPSNPSFPILQPMSPSIPTIDSLKIDNSDSISKSLTEEESAPTCATTQPQITTIAPGEKAATSEENKQLILQMKKTHRTKKADPDLMAKLSLPLIQFPLDVPRLNNHQKITIENLGSFFIGNEKSMRLFISSNATGACRAFPIPIDYRATRTAYGIGWNLSITTQVNSTFISPLFTITNRETGESFSGTKASAPWLQMLKQLKGPDCGIRSFSGAKLFGLSHPLVNELLKQLPFYDAYRPFFSNDGYKRYFSAFTSPNRPSSTDSSAISISPISVDRSVAHSSAMSISPLAAVEPEIFPIIEDKTGTDELAEPESSVEEVSEPTSSIEKVSEPSEPKSHIQAFEPIYLPPLADDPELLLSDITIFSLGKIVDGGNRIRFWTSTKKCVLPYPLGYHSQKKIFGHTWDMIVSSNHTGPHFIVKNDSGLVFSGDTPNSAWMDAFKAYGIKGSKTAGKGFFGFLHPLCKSSIMGLKNYIPWEVVKGEFPEKKYHNLKATLSATERNMFFPSEVYNPKVSKKVEPVLKTPVEGDSMQIDNLPDKSSPPSPKVEAFPINQGLYKQLYHQRLGNKVEDFPINNDIYQKLYTQRLKKIHDKIEVTDFNNKRKRNESEEAEDEVEEEESTRVTRRRGVGLQKQPKQQQFQPQQPIFRSPSPPVSDLPPPPSTHLGIITEILESNPSWTEKQLFILHRQLGIKDRLSYLAVVVSMISGGSSEREINSHFNYMRNKQASDFDSWLFT